MTTPTAQQFLAAFRTYLGVTESPLGSNRTRVGQEFGWNGVPWCAETVSVALQRAGWARIYWSASTDQWEAWARAGRDNSRWLSRDITPRPGDLCIWDWKGDGTANHISAVETVQSDGRLVTLGGNESNRCQRAVRSKSGLRGFIRLPFASVVAPPKPPENDPVQDEIDRAKKENKPMLVTREESPTQHLFLYNDLTMVAHEPLMKPTPTTPEVYADNVMWNFLINWAKYTKTFVDPRPKP